MVAPLALLLGAYISLKARLELDELFVADVLGDAVALLHYALGISLSLEFLFSIQLTKYKLCETILMTD